MKIREYLLENYEISEINDIATHGCSGGIGGFIYYHETIKFHDEHEDEIWDMLYEDAAEFGNKNITEFIAHLNGAKNVGSMAQLKNLLCWYAVEREANNIINESENEG